MEIRQIIYVNTVANKKSFSKAAERLYITQPTLSQQIKKLEEELGFLIFARSTRAFSLTPEGEQFLQLSAPLLSAYDALISGLEIMRGNQETTIRLGLFPTFTHLNIFEKIHRFQSDYPNVKLNLQIERSAGLIDLLLHNEIDVAIANITDAQMLSMKSILEASVFSQDCLHAIICKANPLAAKNTLSLNELEKERIIMLNKHSSVRIQMENAFRTVGIRASCIHECPDIQSMIGLICSNEAIGFLSSKIAAQHTDSRICSIPLIPEISTKTAVVYLRSNRKHELLKQFEQQITEANLHSIDHDTSIVSG